MKYWTEKPPSTFWLRRAGRARGASRRHGLDVIAVAAVADREYFSAFLPSTSSLVTPVLLVPPVLLNIASTSGSSHNPSSLVSLVASNPSNDSTPDAER